MRSGLDHGPQHELVLGSLVLATVLVQACNLMPYFEQHPGQCAPGLVEQRPCGACRQGLRVFVCREDQQWVAEGSCEGDPFDSDGDGFANAECFLEGLLCCGQPDCDDTCSQCFPGGAEVPGNSFDEDCSGAANDADGDGHDDRSLGGHDCDDSDPLRWLGHADLDGDGQDAATCGGTDCDDTDAERWQGHADLDGDNFDAQSCGGTDCDDADPLRWFGHADLDGDGRNAESCGGDDCDDDDPFRWQGHTDLDGDGHEAAGCGGDDCNDDDPLRWQGHADLDADGFDDLRCGGRDCDDNCFECFPGGVEICAGSRDHNCDGEVDELKGCRPPDPQELCILRTIEDVGDARDVFVTGTLEERVAYVASRDGLYSVDVGGIGFGGIRGWLDTGDSWGVFVEREAVYVAASRGLYVADFRRPDRPVLRAGPVATGDARGVFVVNAQAVVASVLGLSIVDVWDQDSPVLRGSLGGLAQDSRGIHVRDGLGFVASSSSAFMNLGFYVADLHAPHEPERLVGPLPEYASEAVFVSGEHAYLASAWGLIACEVSTPETPDCDYTILGIPLKDVFIVGHYGYLVGEEGLFVADVSEPRDAQIVEGPIAVGPARAVFVSGERLFVAGVQGLHMLSLQGDCS